MARSSYLPSHFILDLHFKLFGVFFLFFSCTIMMIRNLLGEKNLMCLGYLYDSGN